MSAPLGKPAQWLGAAGLLPQIIALAASHSQSLHWSAIAAGCIYAALIFTFLGGIWWAQAVLAPSPRWSDHLVAVAPSLIALGAMMPWCFGLTWPGPSLVVLGCALLTSPLVDLRLARNLAMPAGWLRLRRRLSVGLGLLTLALALG